MDRFAGVDLSSEKTLARMAKQIARNRVEIITELADYLYGCGQVDAAKLLQAKAGEELKEVGL